MNVGSLHDLGLVHADVLVILFDACWNESIGLFKLYPGFLTEKLLLKNKMAVDKCRFEEV